MWKCNFLFFAFMSIVLCGTAYSQTGKLYLITFSDNASSRGAANTAGVSDIDCFRKDVAEMTRVFAENVAPQQLRIYHFVTDTNKDKLPFEMSRENTCRAGCSVVNYVLPHGDSQIHLANKPSTPPLKDITIVSELRRIANNITKNDSVVVYFSGHGMWEGKDDIKYRISNTRQIFVKKNDIIATLKKAGLRPQESPKWLVVFSDSCSVLEPSAEKTVASPRTMASFAFAPHIVRPPQDCLQPNETTPLFRSLFFEGNGGIIDICAAPEGKAAISFTGPRSGNTPKEDEYGGIFSM